MRRAARPLLYLGVLRRRVRPGHGPRRASSATTPSPGRAASRGRVAYAGSSASSPTASGCPTCPGPARPRWVRRSAPPSSAPSAISLAPAVRRRRPAAPVRRVRLGAPAAGLVPALRRAGRRRAVRGRGPRPRASSSPTPTRSPRSSSSCRPPRSGRRRSWPAVTVDDGRRRRRERRSRSALDGDPPDRGRARPRAPRTTRPSSPRPPSLHEQGVRVRSLTLFYEEWLGQAADLRARAGVAALRHRRGAPAALRPGQADRRRAARARRAASLLAVVVPVRVARQPGRQPGAAALPAGAGRQGRRQLHDPEVPHHDAAAVGDLAERVDHRGRSPDHALRAAAAPHPPRRAPAGGQHPAGRPRRGRARGPSSPHYVEELDREAALLPAAAPRAARASPGGRR